MRRIYGRVYSALRGKGTLLTLASLVVASITGCFIYLQIIPARRQAHTSEIQNRPYVKYIPMFLTKKPDELGVNMVSENLSPIPALTIYSDLRIWINGNMETYNLFNRTGDVLYEHKNGGTLLQPAPRDLAKRLNAGLSRLNIGTCVIYKTLDDTDNRRWTAVSLYTYSPGIDIPITEFTTEDSVSPETTRCDAIEGMKGMLNKHSADK